MGLSSQAWLNLATLGQTYRAVICETQRARRRLTSVIRLTLDLRKPNQNESHVLELDLLRHPSG
jgi:hypothetical protein